MGKDIILTVRLDIFLFGVVSLKTKAGCPKFALQLRPPIGIDSVGRRRLELTEFKKNKLLLKPRIGPDLIARWETPPLTQHHPFIN